RAHRPAEATVVRHVTHRRDGERGLHAFPDGRQLGTPAGHARRGVPGMSPRAADLAADYVVVGAGSAGAALAARLSENPSASVLLLEAGGPDKAVELHVPAAFSKLFRGAYDWSYDTVSQPELEGRTIFWPRGRTIGGSSSLNAMMWVRGFAADYDEWADAAGPRWSWEALLPYFDRVESTRPIEQQRDPRPHTAAFLEAVPQAGWEVTPANLAEGQGFSQTMVTQRRGARASTADAYLRPARRRANLRVRTDAHVRRVTFSPDADGAPRATGVYVDIGGIPR